MRKLDMSSEDSRGDLQTTLEDALESLQSSPQPFGDRLHQTPSSISRPGSPEWRVSTSLTTKNWPGDLCDTSFLMLISNSVIKSGRQCHSAEVGFSSPRGAASSLLGTVTWPRCPRACPI